MNKAWHDSLAEKAGAFLRVDKMLRGTENLAHLVVGHGAGVGQ